MPSLQYLALSGANGSGVPALTDKGLLMLANTEKLKQLNLATTGTKITDEAIERLKKANADLNIQVQR